MPQQTSSFFSKTASGALTFSRKKRETNKQIKGKSPVTFTGWKQPIQQFNSSFSSLLVYRHNFTPLKINRNIAITELYSERKCAESRWCDSRFLLAFCFDIFCVLRDRSDSLSSRSFHITMQKERVKFTVLKVFCLVVWVFFLLTVRSYLAKQLASHKAHTFNSKKHSQYCKALNSFLGSHSKDATTLYVRQWYLTLDSHSIPDFQIPQHCPAIGFSQHQYSFAIKWKAQFTQQEILIFHKKILQA